MAAEKKRKKAANAAAAAGSGGGDVDPLLAEKQVEVVPQRSGRGSKDDPEFVMQYRADEVPFEQNYRVKWTMRQRPDGSIWIDKPPKHPNQMNHVRKNYVKRARQRQLFKEGEARKRIQQQHVSKVNGRLSLLPVLRA